MGTDVIDVNEIIFTPELLDLIPVDLAHLHKCLPVGMDGEIIHLCMIDPLNPTVLDELAFFRLEGAADSDVEIQASIRRGMLAFASPPAW